MSTWTKWYDRRPEDPKALYWWRVGPCQIDGVTVQPQWVEKLHYCGMGFKESEYWPPHSHWDGYRRYVPQDMEWMPAEDGVKERQEMWNLDLLPCPFCGSGTKVSQVNRSGGGVWIGSPPWRANSFQISCANCFAETGWTSLPKVIELWNRRTPTQPEVETVGGVTVRPLRNKSDECPYEVPAFKAIRKPSKYMMYWWSWHPNYPYWSKSCWGGNTVEDAVQTIESPFCSSMHYYHNVLVREDDNTVVRDLPCQRMDIWKEIAEKSTQSPAQDGEKGGKGDR